MDWRHQNPDWDVKELICASKEVIIGCRVVKHGPWPVRIKVWPAIETVALCKSCGIADVKPLRANLGFPDSLGIRGNL
jgi:hypothetical protein